MAFSRYDSDKQVSYMDGIPVKISEKYKPPKKITLPGAVLNKLNDETVLPEYDFTLERSMVEKMTQWRSLRQSQKEARKQQTVAERKSKTVDELKTASENRLANVPERAMSPPASEPYPILTPVPINASTHSQSLDNYAKSFNFSDFEQDTSSPFDNMELKTINDLEELAHVLQPVVLSDENKNVDKMNSPPRINGINTQHNYNYYNWSSSTGHVPLGGHATWNQMGPHSAPTQSYVVQRVVQEDRVGSGGVSGGSHQMEPLSAPSQSYVVQRVVQEDRGGCGGASGVPDIVQQLQEELRGKREAEARRESEMQRPHHTLPALPRQSHGKSPVRATTCESLPNPYVRLPVACQRLCNQLAEMGFPLSRVARAAQRFGDDEPKIVEFLVHVQRLEEMNYPSERVEKALVANEFKEKETIDYLKCLGQLIDLGFSEDKVEKALEESGMDSDKALDLLLGS